MKSYCSLFSRINNCFLPAFFFFFFARFLSLSSFFFFFSFSVLSLLFSVLHISHLFSVDFVMAWWLTVGNGLRFAPISISAWWCGGWRLEMGLGLLISAWWWVLVGCLRRSRWIEEGGGVVCGSVTEGEKWRRKEKWGERKKKLK